MTKKKESLLDLVNSGRAQEAASSMGVHVKGSGVIVHKSAPKWARKHADRVDPATGAPITTNPTELRKLVDRVEGASGGKFKYGVASPKEQADAAVAKGRRKPEPPEMVLDDSTKYAFLEAARKAQAEDRAEKKRPRASRKPLTKAQKKAKASPASRGKASK